MELVGSSSSWARKRFGSVAEEVRTAVPHAMAGADALALRSSAAGEMTTGHVYGQGFWLKSNELLIQHAREIEGVTIRRLRHVRRYFECVTIDETSTVMIPIRVHDRDDEKRVKLQNPPSDSLAFLLGPSAVEDQPDTLDNELFGLGDTAAEADSLRELDRQIADFAAVVAIAVECSVQAGVSRLMWGDLQLVEGERLAAAWTHSEPLDLIPRGSDFQHPESRRQAVGDARLPEALTRSFDSSVSEDIDQINISLKSERNT